MRRFVIVPAATLLMGCKSTSTTNSPPLPTSQTALSSSSASPPKAPPSEQETPAKPPAPAERVKEATVGDAAFAANLYRHSSSETGNRLVSPISVRIAFAMAYAGAKGETATEIHSGLQLQGEPGIVHDRFRTLIEDFESRAQGPDLSKMEDWRRERANVQRVTLRVVNRIWGQKGRAFVPTYKSTLAEKYRAPMEELDFAKDTEGSRLRINGWVAEKTEQKIKDLIPKGMLTSVMPLVLTNAVYFKAQWENPFQEHATKQQDFFVDGTRPVNAAMMHGGGIRSLVETSDATVLRLPYGDPAVAMYFVLPKRKTGLKAIEGKLSANDFATWTKEGEHVLAEITIPKFKFEAGLPTFIDTMTALGIKRAFKFPDADFTGADTSKELYIGAAVHKTYIDLNEKGTEAAAATALAMAVGGMPPQAPPKLFVADHPFLFFIHDQKSNAILFLGRVADPTKG